MSSNSSPFDHASMRTRSISARSITDTAIAISKSRVVMALLFIVAVVAIAMTFEFEWALQLSGFGFGLGKAVLGLAVIKLVDEYIFHGFDVRYEIKNGNVAAAIYLVGLFGFLGLVLWST